MAEAELLVARGRHEDAKACWRDAARLETKVFDTLPVERGKTRGIIAVSAVALYHRAGALDEAVRTGEEYLATGGIPSEWQAELRALIDTAKIER
jgi:hypothetical protein